MQTCWQSCSFVSTRDYSANTVQVFPDLKDNFLKVCDKHKPWPSCKVSRINPRLELDLL